MIDKSPFIESVRDPVIGDPLSPVSREERKALLIASFVAIALTTGGLTPQKIPVFEIELSGTETANLYYLITGILLYYLAAFYIYGRSDLHRRKAIMTADRAPAVAEAAALLDKFKGQTPPGALDLKALEGLARVSEHAKLATKMSRFGTVRIAFDFYLPLGIGFLAVTLVLAKTWAFPWARIASAGIVASTLGLACYLLWNGRRRLIHFGQVLRHKRDLKAFHRLAEKLKGTPVGAPGHAALQQKVTEALQRTLKGPWV